MNWGNAIAVFVLAFFVCLYFWASVIDEDAPRAEEGALVFSALMAGAIAYLMGANT